jgi:hypothetical protein
MQVQPTQNQPLQLQQVAAISGWRWISQGFQLFRQQPFGFLSLLAFFLMMGFLLALIPLLGSVVYGVMIQGLSMGMMTACRFVEQSKPIRPALLLAGFTAYGRANAKALVTLGAIYCTGAALVIAFSLWLDDGTVLQLLQGQEIDTQAFLKAEVTHVMLVAVLGYVVLTAIFWYAPFFICWHQLPAVKALFFSVVAVWRNKKAFLVYGLSIFGLGMVLQLFLGFLGQFFKPENFIYGFISFGLLLTYLCVTHCAVYISYKNVIVSTVKAGEG